MRINAKQFQVIAIAALFLVPVIVAWFLYSGRGPDLTAARTLMACWPTRRSNSVTSSCRRAAMPVPRRALPGAGLSSTLSATKCATACEEALIRMRQVRLALGKDASRVQRVFLPVVRDPDHDQAAQAFPGMVVLPAGTPGRSELIERIGARQPGEVLLVDPLGNLILSYPPGLDPDGLFRDAKHLLRLSKIG